MELVSHLLLIVVLLFLLVCLFILLKKIKFSKTEECECCTASGHPGEYRLTPGEQLVAVSYPGPPRQTPTVNLHLAHNLLLPNLLPIVTVTNRAGSLDVVVETWPHEHWYPQAGPPSQPDQPQPAICDQNNLVSAKVFPEEGQPGIDRIALGLETPTVEARPIYFVRLDAGQSTTVYAAPPGGWIRLRALDAGASGGYCVSWCCPQFAEEEAHHYPPDIPPHIPQAERVEDKATAET